MSRQQMELWSEPSAYVGYNPDRDYLLLARNRESCTVDESNWEVALRMIQTLDLPEFDQPEERYQFDRIDPRSSGWFYIWRASHCLVGWVDYLMIRGDAPQALIDMGHQIVHDLDVYPILDDDHFSKMETEQIYKYWGEESLHYRIKMLAESGDSIFAARRNNDIPEATFDRLRDTWT